MFLILKLRLNSGIVFNIVIEIRYNIELKSGLNSTLDSRIVFNIVIETEFNNCF